MAAHTHVEYVGFRTSERDRSYTLRLWTAAAESCDYVVVIPNEAFLAHRVRYQDAPEICFLKLQRELAGRNEGMTGGRLDVTDADLEDYRLAHAPKTAGRRQPGR